MWEGRASTLRLANIPTLGFLIFKGHGVGVEPSNYSWTCWVGSDSIDWSIGSQTLCVIISKGF